MGKQTDEVAIRLRWYKLNMLVTDALVDSNLRRILQSDDLDEKRRLLVSRGFTEGEMEHLAADLEELFPPAFDKLPRFWF